MRGLVATAAATALLGGCAVVGPAQQVAQRGSAPESPTVGASALPASPAPTPDPSPSGMGSSTTSDPSATPDSSGTAPTPAAAAPTGSALAASSSGSPTPASISTSAQAVPTVTATPPPSGAPVTAPPSPPVHPSTGPVAPSTPVAATPGALAPVGSPGPLPPLPAPTSVLPVAPAPTPAPSPTPKKTHPPLPPVPPIVGTPQKAGPTVDCAKHQCLALTFDDGPGPYTEKLLDELAQAEVPATFFLVGRNVERRPELVARMVQEGHAVGNHTWDHVWMTKVRKAVIANQVDRTAAAIGSAAGVTTTLMRPPYGATDARARKILAARNDAQILWSVDTRDWATNSAKKTTKRAVKGARPGAIVLMHDTHASTVKAVPKMIAKLRKRGYTFVTVPQLLGSDLTPGAIHYGR